MHLAVREKAVVKDRRMWISPVKKEESPVIFGCSVLINAPLPPAVSVVQAGLELLLLLPPSPGCTATPGL